MDKQLSAKYSARMKKAIQEAGWDQIHASLMVGGLLYDMLKEDGESEIADLFNRAYMYNFSNRKGEL